MQIDTLRRVPLLSNLSDEQLQCITEMGTEIEREAGTQLANQGDPPDGFYMILEGQTEWFRNVGGEDVSARSSDGSYYFDSDALRKRSLAGRN